VIARPSRSEDLQIMMKLYTADLSAYSARVRMQIYAKGITGITFELPEDWGMPKFRERFPIGRVPVLDIDGDLMPESEVIAEYLEEIYPEPSLLGTTPRETAHIRTLARIADSSEERTCRNSVDGASSRPPRTPRHDPQWRA
jgi:glutathione S-transferase